jgi:hypothetical protein
MGLRVSGKVVVDFRGDGPGVVDASGAFSIWWIIEGLEHLTSNGVPVAVTMSGDVYTGNSWWDNSSLHIEH